MAPRWPLLAFQGKSDLFDLGRDRRSQHTSIRAGSHKWGKTFRPIPSGETKNGRLEAWLDSAYDAQIPDINGSPDSYDIVTFEMARGGLLAFNTAILHRLPRNPDAGAMVPTGFVHVQFYTDLRIYPFRVIDFKHTGIDNVQPNI